MDSSTLNIFYSNLTMKKLFLLFFMWISTLNSFDAQGHEVSFITGIILK